MRHQSGVVWLFMVLPVPAGVAILWFAAADAVAHGRQFTAADWFWQVGWFGLLGPGLAAGLPAAGWQELRRRRRTPPAAPSPPGHRRRNAGPGAGPGGGSAERSAGG